MSNEETKNAHNIGNLENQGIDGKTVMGGGANEIGLTEDNFGQAGMVSSGSFSADSVQPNVEVVAMGNPENMGTSGPNPNAFGPLQNDGGMLPMDLI